MLRRILSGAALATAAFLFLASGPAWGQSEGAVLNGDFETGAYAPQWTLTGGNSHTQIVKWATSAEETSWCLKRRPGNPENGGIQQNVYLMAGITYIFSADVAAQYCAS